MSQPLPKSISFFALAMIATGSCIGSGIFVAPSDVVALLSNGKEVLAVWVIGGVMALTGALTFGELAARFPGTGGVYLYLREAYGDFVAFLYGWITLTVITSGAIAGLSIVFAQYFCSVAGIDPSWIWLVALIEISLVTAINILGVKFSSLFTTGMTVIKLVGIGLIILLAYYAGTQFSANWNIQGKTTPTVSFGLALIGVFWSYGGWHHASYVGGEVINAQKVVPRALIAGALIVTITYVLVNIAYMSLLSLDEIGASTALAADSLIKVTTAAGIGVGVLIAVSTIGTAGIYTLSAPRIYFMMGRDRVFFSWLGDIHPKYGTPFKAILLQSGWACFLLLVWGTFANIATYVVFMDWIFMTMGAMAIFIFRKKMAGIASGFRVPVYPVIPAIFIGISFWFLISTLIGRPIQAIAGLVLLVIGIPVFWFFKSNKAKGM